MALMEQIIMILVFALAAAVCLQAFVYSDNMSQAGRDENLAASYAQEVIETCKSYDGDLDRTCEALEGTRTEDGLVISHDDEFMKVYLVVTQSTSYLDEATVRVESLEGESIYELDTAWQKEAS